MERQSPRRRRSTAKAARESAPHDDFHTIKRCNPSGFCIFAEESSPLHRAHTHGAASTHDFLNTHTIDNGQRTERPHQTQRGLFALVQRTRRESRPRRTIARARLHGDQALWLCHLGTDTASTRRPFQSHGRAKRLLPPAHPQKLSFERSGARGGICQRMRCGDPLSTQNERRRRRRSGGSRGETRRRAHHSPHLRNHDLEHLPRLDQILARSARAVQPMVQRDALGNAHAFVPPHV